MSDGLPTKDKQRADFQRMQQQAQTREHCYREMLDVMRRYLLFDAMTTEQRQLLAEHARDLIAKAEGALRP